jgi:proline iminopeptidase
MFSAQSDVEGLKKINGTSLFVSVKGSGEPLLIIHGGPGLNHSYFLPFLQGLEKNLRVIYYDQRACGRSLTPSRIP